MPPLTVVDDAPLPQDIVPTKMAALGKSRKVEGVKVERLAALKAAGLAQIWQVAAVTPATKTSARVCKSQTIQWQRSCSDMGYPESFGGSVQGITEVDCGAQLRRESWLTNSCASVIAQLPVEAVVAPVADSVAQEPAATRAAAAPAPVAVPDIAPIIVAQQTVTPPVIAGTCGVATTSLHSGKPETGLCASGEAENIVGNGPWQWSCRGSAEGVSATCFAPIDFAALAARQAQGAAAPSPAVVAPSLPPVQEAKAPDIAVPKIQTEVQPAPQLTLTTPQLVTPSLTATATVVTQPTPLATAALATPRLDFALRSNRPEPGSTDYAPAAPIRAAATLYPGSAMRAAIIPSELKTLAFAAGQDAPEEALMAELEVLGQKLAVNRLARVTVTAYAGMGEGVDARAARKLSLARAMVVRDALMMGGATSDQVRMRALGANVAAGSPERVDLTDY